MQNDRTINEAWEGRDPAEYICDVAWGHLLEPNDYELVSCIFHLANG